MSLQVKKLKGPNQINVDAILPDPPNDANGRPIFDRSNPTTATLAAENDDYFYCELGGAGAIEPFTLTLRFYNNRGVDIENAQTLQVTEADVVNRRVYFTVDPGTELTGTTFYIHALITNTETGADNVSYSKSSYHETIKHVNVYAERTIRFLYWSDQDEIRDMEQQEGLQTAAGITDQRYIHIKTTGMYEEVVNLQISDNDQPLLEMSFALHRNHRKVAIDMKDMLARHCSLNSINRDNVQNLTINLTASVSYSFYQDGVPVLLEAESTMELRFNETAIPPQNENNGAVIVRVNEGRMDTDTPTRYRDFLIGYMCHIEGVGRLVNYHDNQNDNNAKYTIYPFHIYKIMLRDLVACGLVSLEEASYLTTNPRNTQGQHRMARTDLENNFNKRNAPLNAYPKQLISIFQDNTYRSGIDNRTEHTFTNRANIRKVLTQVSNSQIDELQQTGRENIRFVCRDAWQKRKSDGRIFKRNDSERYSYAKECPFGEFFVNRIESTFNIYISRNPHDSTINVYNLTNNHPESPNRMQRIGIAFHQGTSSKSIGCITFNSNFAYRYSEFENILYPAGRQGINRMLNFVCIDERNAVSINPDSQGCSVQRTAILYDESSEVIRQWTNVDFYRYFDLIEPDDTMTTEPLMSI